MPRHNVQKKKKLTTDFKPGSRVAGSHWAGDHNALSTVRIGAVWTTLRHVKAGTQRVHTREAVVVMHQSFHHGNGACEDVETTGRTTY